MTEYDAVHIRQLIEETIASHNLVTADMLAQALHAMRLQTASDSDLQDAVQTEKRARQQLEQRLSQLEDNVAAIDDKMGQLLTTVKALKTDQRDHIDDVKALRNEVHALATASETLLELSKQRHTTTNHVLAIIEKHSQMLNNLTDEGNERAEELVRMEASMTSTQAAIVANQTRLQDIAQQIDKVDDVLNGLGVFVTMVTSKRTRSILIGAAALLFSAAFDVDVIAIVDQVVRIVGGP